MVVQCGLRRHQGHAGAQLRGCAWEWCHPPVIDQAGGKVVSAGAAVPSGQAAMGRRHGW
jgi:hypothetical protein